MSTSAHCVRPSSDCSFATMRAYRAVRAPHDDDAPRWNVAAGAGLALLVASATGAPAAILWLGLPGGGSAARAACPATPSTRPTSSCRAAGTSPAPDRSVSGRVPNSPSPEAARPAAPEPTGGGSARRSGGGSRAAGRAQRSSGRAPEDPDLSNRAERKHHVEVAATARAHPLVGLQGGKRIGEILGPRAETHTALAAGADDREPGT